MSEVPLYHTQRTSGMGSSGMPAPCAKCSECTKNLNPKPH
jgi:hypothetical protein